MRLVQVKVENYKLINDSSAFRIGDLTCLVGKNESGKTTLLRALHRLNRDDPDEEDFDVETEYPRHRLFDYKQKHESAPDVVLTTWWSLAPSEVKWIKDRFGEASLTAEEIISMKGYDNVRRWTVPFDEAAAMAHLVATSGLEAAEQEALPKTDTTALLTAVEGLDSAIPGRDTFQ